MTVTLLLGAVSEANDSRTCEDITASDVVARDARAIMGQVQKHLLQWW